MSAETSASDAHTGERSRFHWPRVFEHFTKPARIPLPRTDATARLSDSSERPHTGNGDFQ